MKGSQGIPGRDGIGQPGPRGETGMKGSQGLPGRDGQPGLQGLTGLPGPDGRPGTQGFPGVPGQKGATGNAGVEGQRGITGPEGPKGMLGQPGQRGDKGSVGSRGQQGTSGPAGPPGPQGQRGPDGPKGDSNDFGSIAFSAMRKSGVKAGDFVTYDELLLDTTSNSFDIGTGTFTCPRSGTYFFSFASHAQNLFVVMTMYVNDSETTPGFQAHEDGGTQHWYLVNFQWSKKLQSGDTVKLKVSHNPIRAQPNFPTYFQGYLVKAEE